MAEITQAAEEQPAEPKSVARYDRRKLSYSTTFTNPLMRWAISTMEWCTGKLIILRWIKKYEESTPATDHRFFQRVLEVMGIPLTTPADQLAHIPKTGPVVVVANHPHGMVDGLVIGDLISRVRPDFRVLTRSLLTELDEVGGSYMISVPFPHDADAQAKGLEMRAKAMSFLKNGGVVAVFPAGVVASSDTMFGPVIERDWNVFTAKMVHRSGATVVPVRFNGKNSRWYQIANRISAVLRQGLLVFEIVNQRDSAQSPTVGKPIPKAECDAWKSDPRGFMAHLRNVTLSLSPNDR